uniref:Uncharacterized protein n=1 Tax=Opuntia streptacantha TaxID=393608 RepID=A0A7C8YE27_OPUST
MCFAPLSSQDGFFSFHDGLNFILIWQKCIIQSSMFIYLHPLCFLEVVIMKTLQLQVCVLAQGHLTSFGANLRLDIYNGLQTLECSHSLLPHRLPPDYSLKPHEPFQCP